MEMVIIPVIVVMELEIKNEEVEFQCQSWYNNHRDERELSEERNPGKCFRKEKYRISISSLVSNSFGRWR